MGAAALLRRSLARWQLATEVTAARVALHRQRSVLGAVVRRWRVHAARMEWQRGLLQQRAAQVTKAYTSNTPFQRTLNSNQFEGEGEKDTTSLP